MPPFAFQGGSRDSSSVKTGKLAFILRFGGNTWFFFGCGQKLRVPLELQLETWASSRVMMGI